MNIFIKIYLVMEIICLVFSCNKTVKFYYDTGELEKERKIIEQDSIYAYQIEYYKNGNKKSEHYLKIINKTDTAPTGFGKKYYSDGDLKWRGYWDNGRMRFFANNKIPNYDTVKSYIKVKDNQQYVTPNKPFYFRIYVEGLFPAYYYVSAGYSIASDHYLEVTNDVMNDDYPYDFYVDSLTKTECEQGIIKLNREKNCDYVEITVHLPSVLPACIILSDYYPKKYFKIPIKWE